VTRGQLPQRAGSLGLNGGGAAAAVPPSWSQDPSVNRKAKVPNPALDSEILTKFILAFVSLMSAYKRDSCLLSRVHLFHMHINNKLTCLLTYLK